MKTEEVIDALIDRFSLTMRAKFKAVDTPSKWGWFIIPVPGYLASSAYGSVPIREVEWLELDLIEQRRIGQLVPLQPIATPHNCFNN